MMQLATMLRTFSCVALALVLLMFLPAAVHAQDKPRPDQAFMDMVAHHRQAVIAIGTYKADDRPSVRYYGTGFVVADGRMIVTNAHVVNAIRQAGLLENLRLYQPDTTSVQGLDAKVLSMDAHHDVALLGVDRVIGPALELEMSAEPRQGQDVSVIGYPIGMALGVTPTVHKGIISAVVPAVLPLPSGRRLTPELAQAMRQPYSLYQLDMVVYPGNSGSPLIDVHTGKVIGIINKTLATRTREHMLEKPSGISYAVPVRWIHALLARQLIQMEPRENTD